MSGLVFCCCLCCITKHDEEKNKKDVVFVEKEHDRVSIRTTHLQDDDEVRVPLILKLSELYLVYISFVGGDSMCVDCIQALLS